MISVLDFGLIIFIDKLMCRVFDPELLKEKNHIRGLNLRYGQLEGRELQCANGKVPFRRLVAWHYAASCLDNAHKRKWHTATSLEQIPPSVETWLQTGSPGASWPKGDQHVTCYGAASGLLVVYGTLGVESARRASEGDDESS